MDFPSKDLSSLYDKVQTFKKDEEDKRRKRMGISDLSVKILSKFDHLQNLPGDWGSKIANMDKYEKF